MKRKRNIFKKVVSINNLKEAHKKARKGKTKRKGVIFVDNNEDDLLIDLQNKLIKKWEKHCTNRGLYFKYIKPVLNYR